MTESSSEKFCKWSTFAKVVHKTLAAYFFDSQCMSVGTVNIGAVVKHFSCLLYLYCSVLLLFISECVWVKRQLCPAFDLLWYTDVCRVDCSSMLWQHFICNFSLWIGRTCCLLLRCLSCVYDYVSHTVWRLSLLYCRTVQMSCHILIIWSPMWVVII